MCDYRANLFLRILRYLGNVSYEWIALASVGKLVQSYPENSAVKTDVDLFPQIYTHDK